MQQRLLSEPGPRERAVTHFAAATSASAFPLREAEPPVNDGLMSYAILLWKNKVMIGALGALGAMGAFAFSLSQPKQYRAEISVEIQTPNENFLNLGSVNPNTATITYADDSYIQTQADLMSQDWLVEKTLRQLNAEERGDFSTNSGLIERLKRMTGLSTPTGPMPVKLAVDLAKRRLRIETSKKSRIMRVSYESSDPQFAADFVNTLTSIYVSKSVESRWTAAGETRDWLKPQLEELRLKLQKSERELQAYVRNSGFGLSAGRENLEEERLRLMQAEVSQAEADRIAKESRHATEVETPNPAPGDNDSIRNYEVQLTELRKQLADMNLVLTPENQKVQRLQAQIAEVENARKAELAKMRARIGQELDTARRRESTLTSGYGNQARIASESAARIIHYESLKNEVEATRSFYQAMMQKVNEAGVASAIRPSNIRPTGKAEPPHMPFSPKTSLNTLIGLMAGMIAGCCFSLFKEIALTPNAPEVPVPSVLVPELGGHQVNRSFGAWAGEILAPEDQAPTGSLGLQARSSAQSESFRAAAISLLSSLVDGKRPQVIAVTSSAAMEGKTTAVCNLGIALSELGRRVLLIDGDLRGPQLKSLLGGNVESGLTTLLSGQTEIRDVPQEYLSIRTAVQNLHMLPSGGAEVNAVELLCSKRMDDLMKRLRRLFDYVLIDTPPASIFADAKILSLHSDGVVLVRSGMTNDEATIATARRFIVEGLPVIGTIQNPTEYRPGTSYGDYYSFQTASSSPGVSF